MALKGLHYSKGLHYQDISLEFKIAMINYSIFEKGGDLMRQKDFMPEYDPTLVNNVVSGRVKSENVRSKIYDFTKTWYWNFNKKTMQSDE